MIRLKNGVEVAYNKDIDAFFSSLVQTILKESIRAVYPSADTVHEEKRNELILKEIMDNCIFITHQIYEIAKTDEKLSKFLTTGFLFNYVMLLYSRFESEIYESLKEDSEGHLH